MPDITMCANTHCVQHKECYRYTASPGFMQSYFAADVRNPDGSCDYFWLATNRERRADAILTARPEQYNEEH